MPSNLYSEAMETLIAEGEITNGCDCLVYIDEDGAEVSVDDNYTCFGDCWEFAVEDFTMLTEDFRKANTTDWWHAKNLRLWNGEVSGYFHADTVAKLLEGMTVRGDWTMRYKVFADRIEYSLSHHDAPMGSSTTLTAMSEEEVERLGL